MLKIRQNKKKYKIILCDIFTTVLQFRIVLMFIGSRCLVGPGKVVLKCSYFNL
jgi:hypothetical protein